MGKRIITVAFNKEYEDEYCYLMQLSGNRSEWVRQAIRQRLDNDVKCNNLIVELEKRIILLEEKLKHNVGICDSCNDNDDTVIMERELINAVADFDF